MKKWDVNRKIKSSVDDKNHFGLSLQGAKTGKDNGFSVLFDIESFDYGYYDEGSEGLKVSFKRTQGASQHFQMGVLVAFQTFQIIKDLNKTIVVF